MNQRQKNQTIYGALMVLCLIVFWAIENFYTPATYSGPDSEGNMQPLPDGMEPSSTTGEVVGHHYFSLSYNEPYEQAEWVAYVLTRDQLTYDERERPYFIEDPKVRTKSADWRNYRGSGYDRGHLCPAGDRRFSEQAYNETFYTSNISPQDADFNAGLWNRLELQVRDWAKRYGSVFVVTGGVLEPKLEEIGDEDVAVPKQYYKIVARGWPDQLKIIAFLMPAYDSEQALQDFIVTVDSVEERTGIDFFKGLPSDKQNTLESRKARSDWKF